MLASKNYLAVNDFRTFYVFASICPRKAVSLVIIITPYGPVKRNSVKRTSIALVLLMRSLNHSQLKASTFVLKIKLVYRLNVIDDGCIGYCM